MQKSKVKDGNLYVAKTKDGIIHAKRANGNHVICLSKAPPKKKQ